MARHWLGGLRVAKEPVDLLLLVEHVARELDIACAVKYWMQRNSNRRVEIASLSYKYGFRETQQRFEPRVVALPFFYTAFANGPLDVLQTWKEAVWINLSYEQLFSRINQTFKAPKDQITQNNVLHHAWGKFYAEYLREHGVRTANIFINGNPVYMLYCPPYRDYFTSRVELARKYRLDPNKRWVFVAENYGAAFYSEARLKEYARLGSGDSFAYRDFAMSSFKEAARWWHQAGQTDGIEMIVRPRPAVPRGVFVDTCRGAIGHTPAMHVIKEGSVREWILASDMVMSSYSTTLIEAAVAGKPIYMLEPIPFPDYIQAEWYPYVPPIKTCESFMATIQDPGLPNTCKPLQAWAREMMMVSPDPIHSLADWLEAICTGKVVPPTKPDPTLIPVREELTMLRTKNAKDVFTLPWRVLRHIWWRLTKPEYTSDGVPITNQSDKFSQAEVERRVAHWAKVLEA
jgi:surface carbohydrate biosynthesis protein